MMIRRITINPYEKRRQNIIDGIMKEKNVGLEEATELYLESFRQRGRAGGKAGGRPFKYSSELAREANKLSHISRAENKKK